MLDEEIIDLYRRVACATITAQGMVAENKMRELNGESLAYRDSDFIEVLAQYKLEEKYG
jgi:hypothetical protein